MVDVGAEVYAPLGDYRAILPDWVRHPGVFGFVFQDERAGAGPLGYILVGFYQPPDLPRNLRGDPGEISAAPREIHVADLLAIAVQPGSQGRGVGSRLLAYAIDLALVAGDRMFVPEIRLTVADSNEGARRLFERHGFEVIDAAHGEYDGGQIAVRMRRRLR